MTRFTSLLRSVRQCVLMVLLIGVPVVLAGREPAARAHAAPGVRAYIVGTVSWQNAIQSASGRIKVFNSRRPRLGSDAIACRFVVHTIDERDITGGRAIAYWDAWGRGPRGASRTLPFSVHWKYGEVAHHLHLRHCHIPWELNP